MSVELQHIEVAHHQGSNKEFVVGEGVNVLIVVGEVLGCLQDLEEADRHQSTVESVLCPSKVVTVRGIREISSKKSRDEVNKPFAIQPNQVESGEVVGVVGLSYPLDYEL